MRQDRPANKALLNMQSIGNFNWAVRLFKSYGIVAAFIVLCVFLSFAPVSAS